MSEKINLNAYLERIGYSGSIAPTLSTLEALTALHPAAIPFENLNPLLGLPVPLDQKSLERKMLTERRGGYCFEHNLLLMRVLADLEFTVRPLGARVIRGHDGEAEPPVTHMLIGVEISGANYIADVGFGGLTPTAPLRLRDGVEQKSRHETYRLANSEDDWQLDVLLGPEDWRPVYRFTREEFAAEDYEAVNARLANDPASRFTTSLRASISPKGARHNLLDTRLTHHLDDGQAEETLTSIEQIKTVLSETFGIALPESEALDAALGRIIGPSDTDPPPAAA